MAGIFDPGIFDSGIFDVPASGATATTTDAPTTSDVQTRTGVFNRSTSESITTADVATIPGSSGIFDPGIFDSGIFDVPTSGNVVTATTTDGPTTSDIQTRTGTFARTLTDAPTTADVATRTLIVLRTTTDAPTTSESVVGGRTLLRTTTDAPTTADVATQSHNTIRTATDAPHTSDAVTRIAIQSRTVTQVFTGSDVVINHNTPFVSGTAIYIGGVNVAKGDGDPALFASARFMSAVNGVAGEAKLRVRDDTGTMTYTVGDPLELVIDGQRVWTGFVMKVTRTYVFPALNVAEFGPTRFFDIEGSDLNVLLTRRIVFKDSAPEDITAPLYPAHTPDVTAMSDLFAHWLDLTGDGLDTTTDVHFVADINEDQQARAWEGSDTWADAMKSISALPASIFYIRPNWLFAYVDTDTPDAPFGLSDVPNGTTTKGYREMEILLDGTNLANDVLAFGVGYGSNVPVVDRLQDATSLSDHGRWQLGQTTFGIYKQATINRVADSIVNGSPEHHRGAKNDRHAVTLTTYEKGLLPAQKVPFTSNIFGFSEVFPIRKMEVTFDAPDVPKYTFVLSNEIDAPWSFFDPYRLGLPQLPGVARFTWTPPNLTTPGGCPPFCEQPTYSATPDNYFLSYPYLAGSLSVTLGGSPIVVTETDPTTGVFSYSTGNQSATMVACYTVVFSSGDPQVCYLNCGATGGTYGILDSFSRTLTGTWGTADCGRVWNAGSGYGSLMTVANGIGTMITDPGPFSSRTQSLVFPVGQRFAVPFFLTFDLISLTGDDASDVQLFTADGAWGIQLRLKDGTSLDSELWLAHNGFSYLMDSLASPITSGHITFSVSAFGVSVGGMSAQWHNSTLSSIGPITQLPSGVQFNTFALSIFGSSAEVQIDNLDVKDGVHWGIQCTPVAPAVGGPLFGGTTINPTRTDSTHYQLPTTIQPGTAYVWVNGLLYINGTDFTEDDANGIIVFTNPVTLGATVTVSYIAAGPL